MNECNVSDARQMEVHAAEPLLPDPSNLEIEIALQSSKSINRQVMMKFWQNWFKQEAKYCCLRYTNS
jgi:hypothetical protein